MNPNTISPVPWISCEIDEESDHIYPFEVLPSKEDGHSSKNLTNLGAIPLSSELPLDLSSKDEDNLRLITYTEYSVMLDQCQSTSIADEEEANKAKQKISQKSSSTIINKAEKKNYLTLSSSSVALEQKSQPKTSKDANVASKPKRANGNNNLSDKITSNRNSVRESSSPTPSTSSTLSSGSSPSSLLTAMLKLNPSSRRDKPTTVMLRRISQLSIVLGSLLGLCCLIVCLYCLVLILSPNSTSSTEGLGGTFATIAKPTLTVTLCLVIYFVSCALLSYCSLKILQHRNWLGKNS